ncbi:MAG: tetratricopeptide repeat protein [Thermodesulfobacteriota bacterium]
MKRNFISLCLLMLLLPALIAGCSVLTRQARPEGEKSSGTTAKNSEESENKANGQSDTPSLFRFQKPGNSYFNYLMAQRMLRRGQMEPAVRYLKRAIEMDPAAVGLKKELAMIYIQQKKNEKALALAEQVIESQPENVQALVIAGSIRQKLGRSASAKKAYEKVLSVAPERENIYLALGRLYMEDKQYRKAVDVFGRLVEKFPENFKGFFFLGKARAAQGETDKAISAFQKTLDIKPRAVEPRTELIQIYTDKNRDDKVMALYEAIIEDHPDNAAARMELGLLYQKHDRPEDARRIFTELGKKAANDRSAINAVIQNLVARKRYEDAIVVLDGMLEGAPMDPDIHYLAGVTRYLSEQFDEALSHLQVVGPESRFYPNAVIQQAGIYNQQNKPDKAISVLQKAIDDLEDADAADKIKIIKYLSALYEDRQAHEKAAELLQQGIAVDDSDADLHYELGVVYDRMGKKEKAIEQMKTVIDLDSEYADALNYLGYTYVDSGVKFEKAESLIRKALELKPDNGYILDSLGWLYFKKGRYEKALNYLEKAAEKVPDDPIILEHLGDAYQKRNQTEKALDAYQRALSKNQDTSQQSGIKDKIESLKQQ